MSDKLATIYIWITMLVTVAVIAVMLIFGRPEEEVVLADAQNLARRTNGVCFAQIWYVCACYAVVGLLPR